MRESQISRKTKETEVSVTLHLDGAGGGEISTGIGFFDHMLDHVAGHGLFYMDVKAVGDIHVDYHHTVEDVGLSMGDAFKSALGDKQGVGRYGFAAIPMDEALAQVAVDLSGRPFLVYENPLGTQTTGRFNLSLVSVFLKAFSDRAAITLNVAVKGEDPHHCAEAIFKALGRALRQAVGMDPGVRGVPSTKGILE
jgi:imidazoleglycerol-phosphate dehydratase